MGKAGTIYKFKKEKHFSELDLEKEKFEENTKLERQKLDYDIIKMVLQSSGSDRAETLGFMVDTNLISDPEIQKGVKEYLAAKKPVPQIENKVRDIGFGTMSPDGELTAQWYTSSGNVELIETGSGRIRTIVEAGRMVQAGLSVYSMTFSPDSRLLAIDFQSGRAGIWDVVTLGLKARIDSQQTGLITFTPDGKEIRILGPLGADVYDLTGKKVRSEEH